MSNAGVIDVMRTALQQYGYKESPSGSNNTKYGKAFGMNGQPWCFIFEWWCGEQPKGSNPFPHSANAAYGQDDIVTKKGGEWVMKKTASVMTKKTGLKKVRFGDCVDFDFGKNNKYRQHTALAVARSGDYYVCIEGNTSFGNSGSQSNGGCVALRFRHYTEVCSIARPKYTKQTFYKPTTAYTGKLPALPDRGYFKYGDKSAQVKRLQMALKWANGYDLKADKQYGGNTFAEVVIFQVANGLKPDGEFGAKSLTKLKQLSAKSTPDKVENRPVDGGKPNNDVIAQPKIYNAKKGEKCLDVSAWQGKITTNDWRKVKSAGISCVILRSSYTTQSSFTLNKDKVFDYNVNTAIAAGMHVGVYHYSQATNEKKKKKEAKFCLSCIAPYQKRIDLPVAFDWEFGKRLNPTVAKKNGMYHTNESSMDRRFSTMSVVKNAGRMLTRMKRQVQSVFASFSAAAPRSIGLNSIKALC